MPFDCSSSCSLLFYYFVVYLCILTTGMQKGDEASPSINLARQAVLVKMLITLEPHAVFGSNFVYLCILTLSRHRYEKKGDKAFPSIILGS